MILLVMNILYFEHCYLARDCSNMRLVLPSRYLCFRFVYLQLQQLEVVNKEVVVVLEAPEVDLKELMVVDEELLSIVAGAVSSIILLGYLR